MGNVDLSVNYIVIQLMLYFVFYSIVGWAGEVIYYGVKTGHYQKRGFLKGPICPIYGVTMLFGVIILPSLIDDLPYLMLGALIIVVVVEGITGLFLDKVLGVRLWDYHGRVLNLNGYVCIWHSFKAALAVVIAMVFIHPIVNVVAFVSPSWIEFVILIPFYIELVANTVDAVADAWDRKKRGPLEIDFLDE